MPPLNTIRSGEFRLILEDSGYIFCKMCQLLVRKRHVNAVKDVQTLGLKDLAQKLEKCDLSS